MTEDNIDVHKQYLEEKVAYRGYPGLGPSTSQAEHMIAQKYQPGMYPTTTAGVDWDKTLDINAKPAVWVEHTSNNSAQYEIHNIPNEQSMRIINDILPKVMELYLGKSRDYGGNVMENAPGGSLGPKACFPDMWRKMGKLRRSLWDGEELVGEQTEEILMDLVGHILIVLDEMS